MRPRTRRYEMPPMRRGVVTDPKLRKWDDRREMGKRDRKRYEPVWHLCQAYLANRQWVAWTPREQRVIPLADSDEWNKRERHIVNVITPHVWSMISRVVTDDIRPDITFRREDIESDLFAAQCKAMWQYAWEEEVNAEHVLTHAVLKELTYGTSAVRCYFDPTLGPDLGELPLDQDGRPITDLQAAMEYVAQAQMYGQTVKFKQVNEGRTVWEPLSPFNIIPPPGVEREEDFPWLIIERPVSIERIRSMFGKIADELEGEDIRSVDIMGMRDSTPTDDSLKMGELKDHVLLCTGYEMPCPDYPRGYTCIWAGDHMIQEMDSLPYDVDGVPSTGVSFFHFHKVEARFWSQGMVEKAMGIQRQINRAVSQNIEMKDRNLGRVYSVRGTITEANEPVGKIMEHIEVTPGHNYPTETQGVPPGPWIQQEADMQMAYLDRVLGVSDVSRGIAPGGVNAYAALSLLAEQAEQSIQPIIRGVRQSVVKLGKYTIHNVRRYWPQSKKIAVVGHEGLVDTFVFDSARMPESYYIVYPTGPPKPHSPAAELQKIFDLYDRSVAAGRPLPMAWLAKSVEFAKVQEIPEIPGQAQQHKAELENMLIARNQPVFPAQYDDDMLHIEVHRAAQTAQDLIPGAEQTTMMYQQHIDMHVMAHQQKMMMAAQMGSFQPMMGAMAPQGGGGPAGLPPPFPGTEQTAQRGPLTTAGTPNIAGG